MTTLSASTRRQILVKTAGQDDGFARLLQEMLDRLDSAESDIDTLEAAPSSAGSILGGAYIFDDDAIPDHTTTATGLLRPDVVQIVGEGVTLDTFTIGTVTDYRAFAFDAGTYFVHMNAVDASSTSIDLHIQYHTAVPSTIATVATDGSTLESHAAAAANLVTGLLTVTAATKLWGYIDGADADGASMYVHKLA